MSDSIFDDSTYLAPQIESPAAVYLVGVGAGQSTGLEDTARDTRDCQRNAIRAIRAIRLLAIR